MRRFRGIVISLLFGALFWGSGLTVVHGCGEEPMYFEPTVFCQSSLAGDPIFKLFNFNRNNGRSQYQWDKDNISNRAAENLNEWRKYFGGSLRVGTIKELIYKTPLRELTRLSHKHIPRKNKPWEDILVRPEYHPALEYLIYAKQCEPYCAVGKSAWDGEEKLPKYWEPDKMHRLIDKGKILYDNSESAFLKQRYGYQMVRLAQYSRDYPMCIELFNRYIAPLPKSSIARDWAWRHKNGALFSLKKEAEALVSTSMLFDQDSKLMDEAYLDFYIPKEPVWRECLRLAKHPHRQATLWMLRGYKEPRFILEPLRKMVQLEPKSSRVEVMLVYYINQLEYKFSNSAYFFNDHASHLKKEKASGLVYIRELSNYIASLDKTQFHQPALWYTADAYLYLMDSRYAEADEYLAEAQVLCPSDNSDLSYQIQLLKLLIRMIETPTLTPESEDEAFPVLSWLDAYPGQKNNRKTIHHAFYTVLGQKYLTAGKFPKAYCCMAKADSEKNFLLEFYPTPAEMDQLLTLLAKTSKTPYERVITSGLPLSLDDYLSIAGTQLLRKSKYQEALARFQKISRPYWEKLNKEDSDLVETTFEEDYYNPDLGRCQYPQNGVPHYTKLDFTRKIIALRQKAAKDPAHADVYYYQIANGFFHSPFWGFNEQLWGWWSRVYYDGDNYPFDVNGLGNLLERRGTAYDNEYGKPKIALEYYVKAMNTTKDPELAAKCCFLAGACMTGFSFHKEFKEPGKGISYYFDILRKKYSGTAYYKKASRECLWLKDYLNK